jgi:lipopolysaccharide/colanic/teichoic acid biosynthesis glycosyltransferase
MEWEYHISTAPGLSSAATVHAFPTITRFITNFRLDYEYVPN